MTVDASRLLIFCRAIEETADAGLTLFSKEDLISTASALEDLRKQVDRALLRLSSLISDPVSGV
jgi:hypothetical protein